MTPKRKRDWSIGPYSTGVNADVYELAVLLSPLPLRWLIRLGFFEVVVWS